MQASSARRTRPAPRARSAPSLGVRFPSAYPFPPIITLANAGFTCRFEVFCGAVTSSVTVATRFGDGCGLKLDVLFGTHGGVVGKGLLLATGKCLILFITDGFGCQSQTQ